MKLIDLYFDSTSVIFASRVKRSGVHLVLSGGSLVSCGMYYLVCSTSSDKKMFFLDLAARIHLPFAIVCIFLLSEDWKGFIAQEQRKWDKAPCGEKAQLLHTPHQPIRAAKGAKHPHGLFFRGPELHI